MTLERRNAHDPRDAGHGHSSLDYACHPPVRDACPRHDGKGAEMTINLHDITGQESGIILVETDDGRHKNVVVNWGGYDGLPY